MRIVTILAGTLGFLGGCGRMMVVLADGPIGEASTCLAVMLLAVGLVVLGDVLDALNWIVRDLRNRPA